MNAREAVLKMMEGEKLTHKWFTLEEWATIKNGLILFEDGNQCEEEKFWAIRTHKSWQEGWTIWNGEGAKNE